MPRKMVLGFLILALAFALVACASTPPAQSPAQAPQAAATVEPPTPTTEPPTATPVPPTPTTAPSPTPIPPTATPPPPTPTPLPPTATSTPAATPTVARLTGPIATLLGKSAGITEYSFEYKMTLSAGKTTMDMGGPAYVKGPKMRQEVDMLGVTVVTLADFSKKVIYTWQVGTKTATAMDISKATAGQSQTPGDLVSGLPVDTKIVGTEKVDGKAATIIQAEIKGTTQKIWIWNDKGLPLKYEITSGTTTIKMTYSNYKFAKQPDSLFELPKGMTIKEQ